MPLIGLALGRGIAAAAGHVAPYIAAAVLAAVGVAMLLGDDDATAERVPKLRGFAFLALVTAISLDELALGFAIGLLRISIVVALPLVAAQAVLASQLGLRLGGRLGATRTQVAERLAGACLIAIGALVFAFEI